MQKSILALVLVTVAAVVGFRVAREQGGPREQAGDKAAASSSSDEQAIRAVADAFKAAFDKHDADAIAALFLPDAKVITEDGTEIEGRKTIAELFANQFAENPDTKIEVNVDSIKFVGSELAFEVGRTKTTSAPGEAPELSCYTVVHVKRDGKWMMALARDADGDNPTNHERLQPLAWLVGDWIDESDEATVSTSCKWSDDKNFLMQHIQVQRAGKVAMTVSQRIGWDSVQKCVHSWVFDSEGGFGEGLWTRTDDGWIIKANGIRNDGSTASATNSIIRVGKDAFIWRSTDRVAAGQVGDPVQVRIVRKPPTSAVSKD